MKFSKHFNRIYLIGNVKRGNMEKGSIIIKILFLVSIAIFLVSCGSFNKQLEIIKKAEEIANAWNSEKFKEIYVNPNSVNEVNDYKENTFGILRTVCEGTISFKVEGKPVVGKDKTDLAITMYCNGAVDFKKLGAGYENAVRQEAKKDNFIDNANVVLVKKEGKWLIEGFEY